MIVRRDYYRLVAVLILTIACLLFILPAAQAARKGKKGRAAAEKQTAKRRSAAAREKENRQRRHREIQSAARKGRPDRNAQAEKRVASAEREERRGGEVKSAADKRAVAREQASGETEPGHKGKFGRKTAAAETDEAAADNRIPANRTAPGAITSFQIETTRAARESEQAGAVPDIIEVKEYDPSRPGADYTASMRRPLRAFSETNAPPNVSSRRIEVSIDPARITEIQQALSQKGFYAGEPTGTWDEATYNAMKRFQISQRIDATGYPTAHALKRLGLTSW
ncbi:MAG TPA: peptidoglycan-binding protein [Blastocatellia bacterium]|nr:peptidoglycan-binding protein [Blastocatellia bacterium]